MNQKRVISIIQASIFILSFVSPCYASTEQATLIFTGNMPEIDLPNQGGYAELATLLKQTRQQAEPTFFLFTGASLGPSSLSSLDRGSHIIDILNSLEPDAMGVSKREFSYFEDELSLRSYEAAFPLIASNIYDPLIEGNLDGLTESIIVQKGKHRLGVIAVTDKSVIEEYGVKRVKVLDPEQSIRKQAARLRQQNAELIIVMYYASFPVINKLLNQQVIDLSIHKDNYVSIEPNSYIPSHPNDIFLKEPGVAAVLQLTWQQDNPQSLQIEWQSRRLSEFSPDPQVSELISEYTERLNRLLDQPVGKTTTVIDTRRLQLRTAENALGNFLADSLKQYSDADVAIINSGAIRGDKLYPANYIISRKDIVQILPYRSEVVTLEASGQQIVDAMENSVSIVKQVKGRFVQISGMRVKYNSLLPPGNRIKSIMINNQPIELGKIYQLATSDYLANGGDGFSMFSTSKRLHTHQLSRLLSDVITDKISRVKTISPNIDFRLIDVAASDNGSQ